MVASNFALFAGETLVFVAGVLVAIGGITKIRRPALTRTALAAAGLPQSNVLVPVFGIVEITLGLAAAGSCARTIAAALGVLFLAFAALTAYLRRSVGGAVAAFPPAGFGSWALTSVSIDAAYRPAAAIV